MADRPETVVLAAVLQAASDGPKEVRLSALNALGRVGDATCLSTLLDAAIEADTDLSLAAKASLAELPSEKVDAQNCRSASEGRCKELPPLDRTRWAATH